MFPALSIAMPRILLNCPGPDPVCPHDFWKSASLLNFAMRLFVPNPSATYTLPARSHATSDGLLKLSPGTPTPGTALPRPPPPRPPSGPAPRPAGASAGGFPSDGIPDPGLTP